MWVNVLKHVTNQHTWYNGSCSHGPLEPTEKEWIKQDSAPMQALRDIILDKKLLKSFPFYKMFRWDYVLCMWLVTRWEYVLDTLSYNFVC